jgi:hypothetical protein
MTTDTETPPLTCLADGCDAPLIVTDWTYQTVTTNGGPNQTFIQKDAPRRQAARCEGKTQHEFERYEGFDWKTNSRVT